MILMIIWKYHSKEGKLENTKDKAIEELIKEAEEISTINGLMWPLLYTGVFYLIFSGLLSILFNKIEKKLDYYKI